MIVVAVPVPRMRAALLDLRPHLDRRQIVFDVGSVKVGPAAQLSPRCSGPRCRGSRRIRCSARRAWRWPSVRYASSCVRRPGIATPRRGVRALYERIGCEVIEQTPENHDRVMAHTHALTFFVAKGMLDAGAGMEVPFAPPSFQAIARTIETVRSDAGHLFTAIARDNPFAAEARKQLVQSLSAIDRALDAQAQDPGPDGLPESTGRFVIPDLGDRSPELRETREHIDEVDREIVRLFAQRASLVERAARAKAELGAPVLDSTREAEVIAARRGWAAELKLDPEGVASVFQAIMTMSRRAQRR